MKITVDRDLCIGAGQCVLASEAVFQQDNDGLVVLMDADPGPEHTNGVIEANQICPSGAIWIDD